MEPISKLSSPQEVYDHSVKALISCLLKIFLCLGGIERTTDERNREASTTRVDFEWVLEAAFGHCCGVAASVEFLRP